MKISPGLNLPLWLIAAGLATILPAAMLIFGAQTSMAASATWLASPQDQYWGNANNWTLGGPPGHLNCPPCDTATFNTSSITDVVGDGWGGGSLDGIVFTGDAFTITTGFGNVGAGFFLNGAGIINNSGRTQNIVVPVFQKQGYSLTIENNATAGINTVFTVNGGAVSGATGAFMGFSNNSTAASGTFTVNGGAVSGATGAFMGFSNNSTAASGTFTVNGGAVSGATGASMAFTDNSTAASGTFTVNGGTGGGDHGLITFTVTSTAGNAILIANGGTGYDGRGGTINFSTYSTGGTSRVKVFDNGNLDISSAATNVAIGSIEGTGNVFLGSGNLTVGTNNLSTSFSGRVSGSGQCGGSLGSLAKVGSGTLTFEGRQTNDYLADTVGLILVSDSVINLNFTGPPDEIASLVVNDVPQPAGLYGSPDSGAPHPLPEFAGPGTVQVGSCKDFTQSETSVVSFGNTIVFGFNDFTLLRAGDSNHSTGWLRSTDGGVTWANGGALPNSTAGDAGDPVLARDASSGRIYFATLPDMPDNLIQVFRSTDDGATWIAPVNGAPEKKGFQDKEWITVDNFAGSGQGNVYLVETDFGLGGIYLFRSTDAGSSFGPPGGVPITSGNEGGLIYPTRLKADSRLRWPLTSGGHGGFVTVMPDHSVYVFWLSGSTIQVRKSIDQGQTFAPSVTVVTFIDPGGANGDLGLQGLRNGIDTFAPFRTNRFPHVAINPVSGNMYVAYNDKITSSSPDNSDIFFVQSTDGGAHWSTRTRVNDDGTTTDQWFPNVVVSPGGDKIGILYYSRQEDAANNNLFKYYGRIGSISGGTITFSPSAAVGDTQSLPEFGRDGDVECEYMGDYDQAYAREGSFDVVWSDNRNDLPSCSSRKDPDVFYRRISLATPTPTPTATHTPTPTPTPTATHTPTPTPTASPACMAAAVTTGSATNIASNSATLSGTVNPNGCNTTVHFQYGTTTSYGSVTANQNYNGNTTHNVTGNISGLTASTTYHFRIVATNSAGTRYGSDRTFTTLSATGPPAVTTNPAANIASFSATLNGSLDPHGLTTTAHFQYGTTISYGSTTASQTKTGNTYRSVSANIIGLSASTTYHFRIVATNSGGTTYGSDRTFTTLSATGPPVVTTSPATNVASSSATLNGLLDPHGLTTSVQFQYGTTTSYGNDTPMQSQTGNTYRNIAANIGGLAAHTTYHFRIVATNSVGTRYGSDRTFTTQ